MTPDSPLRQVIIAACKGGACTLNDLTVLVDADPYRLDVPANHRDGQWFAEQLDRLYGPTEQCHLRGVHYAIVAQRRGLQQRQRQGLGLAERAGKQGRALAWLCPI